MNTLLIAGKSHSILQPYLRNIANARPLHCGEVNAFIQEGITSVDLLLYTDDGIQKNLAGFVEDIYKTVEFLETKGITSKIVIATCNSEVISLALPPQIEVRFYFGKRVPLGEYMHIEAVHMSMMNPTDSSKADGWWKKVFSGDENKGERMMPSNLSRGISRVVAMTGHRGSGITSTAVNLAEAAVKEGISAIVIDLDILLRGMNMYFSNFLNTDDENLKSSLIRLLAKPQNYETCAFKVKPGFYMSTLPYTFKEKQLEERFITEEKIITLISVLKNKFNLCILDLPLEVAAIYKKILVHIDVFGLCVNNSLYSILNSVRNLDIYLDQEYKNMLTAKAKIVVTKYNDKAVCKGDNFTPKRVCETLQMVSSDFDMIGDAAGYIPYCDDFDSQIETEVLVANTSERMKDAYKKLLIRMIEGVA